MLHWVLPARQTDRSIPPRHLRLRKQCCRQWSPEAQTVGIIIMVGAMSEGESESDAKNKPSFQPCWKSREGDAHRAASCRDLSGSTRSILSTYKLSSMYESNRVYNCSNSIAGSWCHSPQYPFEITLSQVTNTNASELLRPLGKHFGVLHYKQCTKRRTRQNFIELQKSQEIMLVVET